jgi:putative ABC transport system permease protein
LLTVFAGVALTLAAVGIYGVISYSVAQRTREFGIRMALGAQHSTVVGQVLRRGMLLTSLGLAAGLVGAFALTRFLSSFLFGITATDPATFAGVSLLLGVIAILASYVPARRATKVDPLVALRAE